MSDDPGFLPTRKGGSTHPAHASATSSEASLWQRLRLSPGMRLAGKYEIRRLIGRGGMGVVIEAVNEAIEREVAIKVLLPEIAADPGSVARFEREARAASQVRHAHIVDVLDFGNHDGLPFIVMELLHGETLGDLIRREGALPLDRAIAIIDPVLRALEVAHKRGVVHRDIKTDNVFLAALPDEPDHVIPKVLDFGIAKRSAGGPEDQRLTMDNAALGTAAYMAPEQILAPMDCGPAADQYALATVLFETLSGKLPYPTRSYNETVIAKMSSPPDELSRVAPELPREVCTVVMKALARDPEQRYADVVAFRRALPPAQRTRKASERALQAVTAPVRPPGALAPGALATPQQSRVTLRQPLPLSWAPAGCELRAVEIASRDEARSALVFAPTRRIRVGRPQRDQLAALHLEQRVDGDMLRAVDEREHAPIIVFRGRNDTGSADWAFADGLSPDEVSELGRLLVRAQIGTYRRLVLGGRILIVHVEFGKREVDALRAGATDVLKDLEKQANDPEAPPEVRTTCQADAWILRHLTFYFALGLDTVTSRTLPPMLPMLEARAPSILQMLGRLPDDETASG